MTKNDIYARLIRVGVALEYEVIPEFVVQLGGRKTRKLDLVWARRKTGSSLGRRPSPGRFCRNHSHWDLFAAFEIEGCNVPLETFKRHPQTFATLKRVYGEHVRNFVVLYTAAFDRNWATTEARGKQVAERLTWRRPTQNFRVLDGRQLDQGLSGLFPIT